jgi:hypothetical protein
MTEAAWALVGVIVGGTVTGVFNFLHQSRQFTHNRDMYLLEHRSAEMVKALLTDMLNHRSYTDRSFEALKAPIGGYTDDQIRQFLHEVGAKRATRDDESEWWYLLSRQDERRANRQSA